MSIENEKYEREKFTQQEIPKSGLEALKLVKAEVQTSTDQSVNDEVDFFDSSLQDNDTNRQSEVEQIIAEETNRGVNLDEARLTDNGAAFIYDQQPFPNEQHHWFPQQYRDKFEALDIDIDRYVTDLDRDNHQSVIHARYEGSSPNPEFQEFFSNNPNPSSEEALAFVESCLKKLGYDDAEMHPYRNHSEITTFKELK
jgi:Predicted lipoprotein of unknown function (DUF2380)